VNSAPQPSNLERLQFYRDEIKHEYDLLGQRVSWYVTSQSFLITAYAIAFSREPFPTNWFACYVLPSLAILVSLLSLGAIHGATDTADMWMARRAALVKALDDAGSDELRDFSIARWEPGHIDRVRRNSLWFPKLIPWLFICAWLTTAVLSSTLPWVRHAPDLSRPHANIGF
jgi:hypothetical protein